MEKSSPSHKFKTEVLARLQGGFSYPFQLPEAAAALPL